MDIIRKHRKAMIIFGIALVFIILALFLIWRFAIFRILDSSAYNDNVSTTQSTLVYTFTKELSPAQTKVLASSPSDHALDFDNTDLKYRSEISGNRLTVFLGNNLTNEGSYLRVKFTAVSKNNERIDFSKIYRSVYVPADQQNEEERQQGIKDSSSFTPQFPLIAKLPQLTPNYEITYEYPEAGTNKARIIITTTEVDADAISEPPNSPANLAILKKNRDSALTWLRQNGYTPDKYQLVFPEPYLLKEYNAIAQDQ